MQQESSTDPGVLPDSEKKSNMRIDGEKSAQRRCSVLHLLVETPETVMAYKEFVVAQAERQKISVCTYFRSVSKMPAGVTLFEGNRTLLGFWRALKEALRSDDFDVIHAHFPNVAVPFLLVSFWKKRLMRKTVFTVHTSYQNIKLRNRLLLMLVFLFFRKIICCSRASYQSFPKVYRWLAGKRLGYIRNGVDTKRINQVRQRSVQRDAESFTIITACRFVPIKNLQTALGAFRDINDGATRFTLIGDGPERMELETFCSQTGMNQHVEFTGLIPRDQVYERLLTSDVFISTSFGEGLPIAVMEAMGCGCPVILSDIESHREIAEGIDFIPLVEPKDAEELAKEIARFRDMTRSQRDLIGKQCRQLIEEKFGLETMHAAYESIYLGKEVLEQSSPE